MELIKDKTFGGERPLFAQHDLRLERVTITDGESGIKQCQRMEAYDCKFYGKYPWWHVDGAYIENCYFAVGSRSAIWYTNDLKMKDCTIDGPKFFREMKNVELENVVINDADETFWKVDGLRLKNVVLHEGTYPFMFSKNIYVDGLKSDSKYVFQYCQNVEVHNAEILTKDSFWECENVTIYDSVLDGEYLAWHSKNVRLVNCHLAGEQLLCYTENLVLENCTIDKACDRMFEYSTVEADIRGHIENIKNPTSGHIIADSIGSITIDENVREPNNCVIEISKEMKYDFDELVERRGTNCVKWDESPSEDVIPLWVADMDFRVAPAIQKVLRERVEHGVFGYNIVPESYYEAVISWFRRRHQWEIQRQWILYTTAVVPAMSCVIKALTMPGEKVLILSPAYNCFFTVNCTIDFDDFEAKCADEKTTVFLLCNPHNPSGRVWTREELQRMYDICKKHGVKVVSDEIHCELIMPGHQFVPFGTITDDCVVMNSPSKNFNTAGLQIANIILRRQSFRYRSPAGCL